MKRPNNISVISKAVLCIIIGLSLFVSACSPSDKYAVYQYDNGDDYFSEGLQRIVDKDGKIGFRDSIGKIVISPRYAFAFPFKDGYAKVTDTGHMEAVDNTGEYHRWVSDSWYYIDKTGTKRHEALQKSYSTNDKLKMSVVNPDALKMPVDSIVVEMTNTADEEATYGEWFRIEKFENGKWKKVAYNDRVQKQIDQGCEMVFNDIGYIIPSHQSRTYANPTKAYNENIIPGIYRISKKFNYPPYPTLKSDTAYVEFEIR